MKPLKLQFQIDSKQLESFLYFVQVLDEQLNHFTDDSYKAPALNTFTRTLELQSLALLNHAAGIGKDALIPFVDELEWSVSRDAAISSKQRAIAKVQLNAVRESLTQPDRIARSLAGLRMSLGDYFLSIQSQIKACIDSPPHSKENLARLAAAFVVQAEVYGFPRRHTYHTLQNVIFKKLQHAKNIDCSVLLNTFFSRFIVKKTDHTCVFILPKTISEFPKLLEKYSIEIVEKSQISGEFSAQQIQFLDTCKDTEVFGKFVRIAAQSAVLAHEICVSKFAELMGVVQYVEHRLQFSLSKLSLVIRTEDSRVFMVRDSPDPMHCWSISYKTGEAEMLRLVDVLHGPHLAAESRYRFAKAVQYHGSALRSEAPENQLVDLWAGLEGLLSRPPSGSKRIEFFAESLLPPLTLGYPEKLLRSLYLQVAEIPAINEIIESGITSPVGQFSRFVHLLLCKEYEEQRKVLISELATNPLLMNRAWLVAKGFASKRATFETLTNHREKVKWHIERIYSTRNSIMHNASALPYLATLVENLHVYMDFLITGISRVAIAANESISIESALQYLSSWENYRFQSLSEKSPSHESLLDTSTVWETVFGSDLAVAPVE